MLGIVAKRILIRQATRSPADAKSCKTTSDGQGSFAAEVIIAKRVASFAALKARDDRMTTGRSLKRFAFDLNHPLIKPLRAFLADRGEESPQGLDEIGRASGRERV